MQQTITKPQQQRKKCFKLFKVLLAFLLLFGSVKTVNAQQVNASPHGIIDVDSFLSNLKERVPLQTYTHAKNLLDDLQSSVYFYLGVKSEYGENPCALFTDPQSLSALSNSNINTNLIEIVTIRISQPSQIRQPLDLSVFSNYIALKYIYIISSVPDTSQNIISSVKNSSGNYSIFYKIDLGS